jgi:outer membrane protein TolC
VLQTQRTQLSAEDGLASTNTTLATAHVRLIKALGGGWSSAPTDSATNGATNGAPNSAPNSATEKSTR